MSRERLLNEVSIDELEWWVALRQIEPWDNGYLQAAVVCQTILASQGAKKIPPAWKIFPHLKAGDVEVDPRVQEARMFLWAQRHNKQFEV